MATGLIDKIGTGLSGYYKQRNTNYYNSDGVGKFEAFCDDNGFEDDEDIAEELNETDPDDCTLTDFDDEFPFDSIMKDDNEKIETIFTVLKYIAKHASYPPPPQKAQKSTPYKPINVTLALKMCHGITTGDIERAVHKYSQMDCLSPYLKKDNNLKWFFAVGEKCKYPFLTYMVDTYTRDKAKYFQTTRKALTIREWAANNRFMAKLSIKYPEIGENLQAAMLNYSTRIMRRLLFTPTYKINDDIKEICEYVSAIPAFINKLMDELNGGAPFQIDLYIAVKKVTKQVLDGEDDDDDEDEKKDVNKDYIGDVQHNLDNFPVASYFRDNKETPIVRDLGQKWANFRTKLSEFNESCISDEDDDEKKIKYNAETYPRNRRFCVFVDRRENIVKGRDDKITFFQPPNNCNKIKNGRVPEIGFELLLKCLLPRRNKKEIDNITADTDVCGQLMTFMFNVEEKHEIKCYIVWNQQTMRFEGENMMDVLPYLFEENEENIKFIQEPEPLRTIQQSFIDQMKDAKYDGFCRALDEFT